MKATVREKPTFTVKLIQEKDYINFNHQNTSCPYNGSQKFHCIIPIPITIMIVTNIS